MEEREEAKEGGEGGEERRRAASAPAAESAAAAAGAVNARRRTVKIIIPALKLESTELNFPPLIIICVSGSKLLYFRPNYFLSLGSAARGGGARRGPSHAGAEGGSPPRQHGG